jgi:hypothetical protein
VLQLRRSLLAALIAAATLPAQVHYHDDGRPWKNRARKGPDAEVEGWYYNLGITGLRAELMKDEPCHLLVKHVFDGSPAHGRMKTGDVIVGAGGRPFRTPHRNGYGMEVFGPQGPIEDFAEALERAQGVKAKGELKLIVRRGDKTEKVTLKVGTRYGRFAKSWPADCKKSERILSELCRYLVQEQRGDGSWGQVVPNTFAPLALLATGGQEHHKAVTRAARFHAKTTHERDEGSLINWRYMAAAIVLSEYYLATGAEWAKEELREIRDFILWTQYLSLDQVNPRVRESHPDAWPKNEMQQHGGWGHNPGFEGYGPIAMITGQGALALALIEHCGLEVPRKRHDAAYEFLARGTGKNGYVWYADEVAGHQNWADPGRTGAAGIANYMSPYQDARYRQRALAHARCIGDHPLSFPDTHGSPIMGMGYSALAAFTDPPSFRKLLDANRWWFTLAHCHDKTFYYQPNRDNAGYGNDARILASSVTALIFSLPKRTLHLSGKPFRN